MKFTEFYKNHLLAGLVDFLIITLLSGLGLAGLFAYGKIKSNNAQKDSAEAEPDTTEE